MRTKVSEFHIGYRAFPRVVLGKLPLDKNCDDFVVDNEMLARARYFGFHIGEISCPTRYEPEISSVSSRHSVKHGFGVLRTSMVDRLARWGLMRPRIFSQIVRKPSTYHITGIARQEGACLAELLAEKGYPVHGMVRRASTLNNARIDHLFDVANPHPPSSLNAARFLHCGDLTDASSINRLLREIYNLGGSGATASSGMLRSLLAKSIEPELGDNPRRDQQSQHAEAVVGCAMHENTQTRTKPFPDREEPLMLHLAPDYGNP